MAKLVDTAILHLCLLCCSFPSSEANYFIKIFTKIMNENISNALACTYVDAKKIISIKNFAANFVYFVLIEVILASFRPQSKY